VYTIALYRTVPSLDVVAARRCTPFGNLDNDDEELVIND